MKPYFGGAICYVAIVERVNDKGGVSHSLYGPFEDSQTARHWVMDFGEVMDDPTFKWNVMVVCEPEASMEWLKGLPLEQAKAGSKK